MDDRRRAIAAGYRRHRPAIAAGAIFLISVAFAAIDVRGIWGMGLNPFGESPWWGLTTVAVGCLLVALQRRLPLPALVVGTLVFAVDGAWFGTLGMVLVMHELVYAATASLTPRGRTTMLVVLVASVVGITVTAWVVAQDVRSAAFAGLLAFALLGTPYWWATAVRRAEEVGELHAARADDTARIAELRETDSIRRERQRMAGDLHDVVAGRLAAVALHSEAALSRDPVQDADRAALAAVREAGVSGLAEMRDMILLLRSGEEPLVAADRLDRLPTVVAEAGATLVAGDIPTVPAIVDQSAARVVREALVNAAKHAPGRPTTVQVEAEGGRLRVEVRTAGADAGRGPGTGLGLVTLRERVETLGGGLVAGADGDDWHVRAELPLEVSP
jgi:signal transduction histidine kinase